MMQWGSAGLHTTSRYPGQHTLPGSHQTAPPQHGRLALSLQHTRGCFQHRFFANDHQHRKSWCSDLRASGGPQLKGFQHFSLG